MGLRLIILMAMVVAADSSFGPASIFPGLPCPPRRPLRREVLFLKCNFSYVHSTRTEFAGRGKVRYVRKTAAVMEGKIFPAYPQPFCVSAGGADESDGRNGGKVFAGAAGGN